MKQWVKLDRELTEKDAGKCVRVSNTYFTIDAVDYAAEKVELRYATGTLSARNPPNTIWGDYGWEIEETVTSVSFPNGSSITFQNPPSSDPLAAASNAAAMMRYYCDWGVPNKPVPPAPRHDCYLDGHSIVETGTLRSACKHCEQPAEWDRQSCSWVLKTANN